MEPKIIHRKVIYKAKKEHVCNAAIAIKNMGSDYFPPKLRPLIAHLLKTRSLIKPNQIYVRYVIKDGSTVHTFKAGIALDFLCRKSGVY